MGTCAADPIGARIALALLSKVHPVMVSVFVDFLEVVIVMYSVSGLFESALPADNLISVAYGEVARVSPLAPLLELKNWSKRESLFE